MPSGNNPSPAGDGFGLYLHVPFCLRKCPYCGFYSVAAGSFPEEEFVRAVKDQVRSILNSGWTGDRVVDTIFVGGGTPSMLEAEILADLLQMLRDDLVFRGSEIETSVEVNPATIGYEGLARLRRAGYNRISIGVQSLADDELRRIGRPHTAEDAIRTVREARDAGFANCNIDLMFGLPGQTPAGWRRTLGEAMELAPDHLAIYELTIEEGTPFARLAENGELALPGEDDVVAMMDITEQTTARAGYHRYEISNYTRPGRECLHNINYWRNGCYVGLGPGAVSSLRGRRYTAVADISEFARRIASGEEWWSESEMLDREARFRETVIMGLRMTRGVSLEELHDRFGFTVVEYYGDTLRLLERRGLVEIRGDRLRLSARGMALANRVMAELV